MRALVFDPNMAKVAYLKAAGAVSSEAYTGRFGLVRLDDVPEPRLRGTSWARLRTRLAGVCGSDLGAIELKSSPALTPFSSFPCVLGHEILAEVEEPPLGRPGRDADPHPLRAGERVVVEPFLPCRVRDVPDCARCRDGEYVQCLNVARGELAPGMFLGFNRDLPGGFGERIVAHASTIFRVPDNVPDEEAVLVEPLAVGFHAVLRHPPEAGDRVLVIGGGMVAASVLAALQATGAKCEAASASRTRFFAERAREFGAEGFVVPEVGFEEVVRRATGAKSYRPLLGRDVFQGGFDLVYDCVGSGESLAEALRGVRAGGRVALVGSAGVHEVDWTFVWARELTIHGVLGYGWESWRGRRTRTFQVVLEHLASRTTDAYARLVTHRHALPDYKEAFRANQRREVSGALKTVFVHR